LYIAYNLYTLWKDYLLQSFGKLLTNSQQWVITELPGLVVIVVVILILFRMLAFSLKKLKKLLVGKAQKTDKDDGAEIEKRIRTLMGIVSGLVRIVLCSVFLMIVLKKFGENILEPIEIFGLDQFGDSALVIKARLKTKPIMQWTIGREYRRRLKKAFDERNIEIPFPHTTIYWGEEINPLKLNVSNSVADRNK
jgi:small-conductance mechanosensitive channel